MKFFLTISCLFLYSLLFSQTGKNNEYLLTIKKGAITKEDKQTFFTIPITLTNNSKDTLRYYSMSCSWQDFYFVSNKKLQIEVANCNKNIPIILNIPPQQSNTVELRLILSQTIDASETKFSIGFNLMTASKINKPLDLDFKEHLKKKNIIWSNIISM